MKKIVSIILALVMLCTVIPMNVFAFNEYVVFGGQDGCQLLSLQLTQADNAWLLYDVTFEETNDGRVLTTAQDHPGLVGASAVLDLDYEGDAVYFNGKAVVDGETVKLNAENELTVYDTEAKCYAEYTVNVTEESNGLPVVLIDTDNVGIVTKLDYVDTHITILGADVYGAKDLYYAPGTKEGKGGIKLRGNSTKGYAKKPYRIKFDKKQDVLGLGKAKSWVLLANYLDPAAMRNQLAFNLADRVNKFTAETTGFEVFSPRMKPVEVYLNGEFQGLYDMGDHMQANELRVAVNELGDETDDNDVPLYNNGEEIGYFIEVEVQSRVLEEGADGYEDWSAYSWIEGVGSESGKNQDPNKNDSHVTDALYFQFKLPEVPSDEQKGYITDYMQEVNDLILANDDAVWELLDMDSVIDWYLVNEIFKNVDSQMQSSVYFYKDGTLDEDGNVKENPNTKLYMAPVWDFDLGAGGVSYGEMNDVQEWRTRNDEYCGWFREMFEMPTFINAVETRWENLHKKGIFDAMFTDIDELTAFFAKAAPANYALWHDDYIRETEGTWMTVPEVSYTGDWAAQVSYLENWLKTRVAWMDGEFGYATPAAPNETVEEDAVFFDNEVFTATSAGKVSKTYPINHKMNYDEMAFDLDITTTTAFNFGFDVTVALKIDGKSYTLNLTPSAKNDWQSSSNVFEGTTGKYIAAGTYNDRVMTLNGAIKWKIGETYFGGGGNVTTEQAKGYITSIRLNSVTVTFENAKVGDKATFRLVNEDANGNHATITKTKISGKPVILGEAMVGNTLTASTLAMTPFEATYNYQWYRNGSAISNATGSTYKVTSSDLGKKLTVKVTATVFFSGNSTSDAVTVTLDGKTVATASKPTLSSVTTDTIVVSTKTGYEYSIDGKTWQASGVFANLTAGKAYNVYARVAATSTAKAGAASDALIVVTDVLGLIRHDVDASGEVNTSDVVLVLEQALEFINLHDAVSGECDVNGDGVVNTSDARALLCEIVGF